MANYRSLQLGSETEEEKKRKKALQAENGQYTYDAGSNEDYKRANAQAAQAYEKVTALQDPSEAYNRQLESIYNQYVERQPFSYDMENDPMYRQYRDQYITQGQQAMQDTMGQAAALTGGYGNTYGQTAGQQAYGSYLQQLSALVPELYGMAWDRYNAEGKDLLQQYDMVGQMGKAAYERYRDQQNDGWQAVEHFQGAADKAYDRGYENWYTGQKLAADAEQTAYDREKDAYNRQKAEEQTAYDRLQDEKAWQWKEEDRDYERKTAAEQTAYDRQQDEKTWQWKEEDRDYERETAADKTAYDRKQDALDRQTQAEKTDYEKLQDNYDNLNALIAAGYTPTDAELAAAGMTRGQANALKQYYAQKNGTSSGSSGGNSSGSSGSSSSGGTSSGSTSSTASGQDAWKDIGKTVKVGAPSVAEIKQMQQIFGADADGVWGPKSKAAAGGLDATTVWKNLHNGSKAMNTARAQKFYQDKGTRAQWKARGITDKEYDAMVTQWLKKSGLLPAEICWLKTQFAK